MKNSKVLILVAAVAIALTGAACKSGKKAKPTTSADADSGTTGKVPPDTTHVDPPKSAESPERAPIHEDSIEGPVKNVYFDFDRYEVRPDQRPTMEANASWLSAHAGDNVLIEGHCDERGTEEYNLALGDRRATAAKAYLVTLGIKGGRLSTVTYGKAKPADPGHDESAWQRNRRAEFHVGGAAIR